MDFEIPVLQPYVPVQARRPQGEFGFNGQRHPMVQGVFRLLAEYQFLVHRHVDRSGVQMRFNALQAKTEAALAGRAAGQERRCQRKSPNSPNRASCQEPRSKSRPYPAGPAVFACRLAVGFPRRLS